MTIKKSGRNPYVRRERDLPQGDSPEHLFQVTLVVLAPAGSTPDAVLTHIMAACLNHPDQPLPVVDGYGAAVRNLTLGSASDRTKFTRSSPLAMIALGFRNKAVPKKGRVPVILRRAKKA